MIQVVVDGKKRVIRNKYINYKTDNDLYCKYGGYDISISKQDVGDFYVTVKDKTGCYAVQGGYGGYYCRYGIETIEDCLILCIKNILL